jgi:hypothetical protein
MLIDVECAGDDGALGYRIAGVSPAMSAQRE